MAPLSMLLIMTSFGNPVLVGGPPTIDLFQLTVKLGLKGLGKLWKKGKAKFKKPKTKTTKPKSKPPKNKTKSKSTSKGKSKSKNNVKGKSKNKNKNKPSHKCNRKGEPVDVVTGSVYSENIDFESAGPIPFEWKRIYYSNAEGDGPLGYNWTHNYNMGVTDDDEDPDAILIRLSDGREVTMPKLLLGESYYDRTEQLDLLYNRNGYLLIDESGLHYRFKGTKDSDGYQLLSEIYTSDGFEISFRYSSGGRLTEVIDSRNKKILFDSNIDGHITAAYQFDKQGRKIDLVRYEYDPNGNMIKTTDALGVSKHFEYKGHLMTKLTNQSGMSFYWEYEGEGDDAVCVHTWRDRGVLEYRFEYKNGMTRSRNSLGHVEETYYDENNLIYKIIDATGGITQQVYNEYEELEIVVDPEGGSTKS